MPEKRSCQEASIRPVYRRRPHAIVAGAKQEPAMSTPPEANPAKPAKPSAASRYLIVFLVGLVIGAVALVMILRTVEARKTWQDHYPHAAMHLFDAHMAQLKASTEANRCGATDTLPHLQALRVVANDLEPAFGDLGDDPHLPTHPRAHRAVPQH